MVNDKEPCFGEIQHTADRAIRVSATSPEALFEYCAQGMYSLLKIKREPQEITLNQKIHLEGVDLESLLAGLVEEAPAAYKDVDQVIEAVVGAGITKKVARLKPLVVVKG